MREAVHTSTSKRPIRSSGKYATEPHWVDVANTRANAAKLRRSLARIDAYKRKHPLPELPRDATVSDLMADVTAALDGDLLARWLAYWKQWESFGRAA